MLRQVRSQLRSGAGMGRSEKPAITSGNVYPERVTIEDLYTDVLINIELPVIELYREHPELLDLHVDEGLSALMSRYKAEEQGKTILPPRVKGSALLVFEAVSVNTELMLGRPEQLMDTIDLPTLLSCLARIRKSVKLWTKQGGSRGYLNFVLNVLEQ